MRITLGRLQAADTLAVSVAMMDPQVSGWLHTFPYPYTEVQRGEGGSPPSTADWAVRADGRFVGMVLAAPELGCWIDPKFQGKGIATRASVLALTRLFASGTPYSYARFLPENRAMKAMLDRLGFRPDTSIPSSVTRPDLGLLRLCRDDFFRAQPVVLQTPHLHISPVRRQDQAFLHAIAMDQDISVDLPFIQPGMSPEVFSAALPPFSGQMPLWCKLCVDQRVIGAIGMDIRLLGGQEKPFVQIFLSRAAQTWGAEALMAFTQELQDRFGMTRIHAECFADDTPLAAMLEAAGFLRDTGEVRLTTPQREGPGYLYQLKPG